MSTAIGSRTTNDKLGHIDLVVLDCDGVLTDGQVLVDPSGVEVKRFSLRDGHGISLAREAGIQLAILTRTPSLALEARAKKLGIDEVVVATDKAAAIRGICARAGVSPGRASFVGDDVFDLPAMAEVGLAVAVADAHPRVIARADLVTRAPGGHGAVREFIDLLLSQRTGTSSTRIHRVVESGTYVIAEIGQNHQGDPETARELIRAAKLCGVHAVKSQKRDVKSLLTPEEHSRPYNSPHAFGRTYGEHREALELKLEAWRDLLAFAGELGLDFFASPWDLPSARLLRDLGCALFKIPSAAVTNEALLQEVASYGRPVILSTGMSTLEEIDRAVELLGDVELYILQCTSAYPTSFDAVNLRGMLSLAERYGRPVGLSGHHKGIAVDAAAVALGAKVIERHFTLDRTMKGSDHAASLEPQGLSRLVRDIRAVEASLGDGKKRVLDCELGPRAKLRGALQEARRPAAPATVVAAAAAPATAAAAG
jgi:YrbI family 3-deoxy-D-manno-octulosonate 8-phosphate phosphatase